MILNERILRLILTLAQELHFGRAAALLHVSQPALSGTVKSLERDLGVQLFKRTSRSVELTEAGRVFAAEAGRLIQEAERVTALVRRSSTDIAGPLQVGYPASMNLGWLGRLIAHARKDGFRPSDVQFVSSEVTQLIGRLFKGTLHAAFLTGQLSDPDLQFISLFRETFVAVFGCDRPPALTAPLQLHQLRDEPVVWLRRDVNPSLYDSFMDSCSAQGYRPKIVQEVTTYYECLQFARQGVGMTFLPASMKPGDCGAPCLSMGESAPVVEYTLAYCNGSAGNIGRFVKFVQTFSGHERRLSIHAD